MRRIAALAAVAVLLPLISVLVTFAALKYRIRAQYNECVESLSAEERNLPGLALIVGDLKLVDRFHGMQWNLNAPYEAGAFNILIPSRADAAWHARCRLPLVPADCLAAARERIVICNAVVGRELSDPRIATGLFREEIVRARRFLLLTFLGHELGHVTTATSRNVRHLFPVNGANGLACTHPLPNAPPSDEQRADDYGIAVACEAIKKSPTFGPLSSDAQAAVGTLSSLRDALDDEYFAFDDTCGGDSTYPSMSRRKSTFDLRYAQCLYPGVDLPYAAVARDQAMAFEALEAWLRKRQIAGFIGSTHYGTGAEYQYVVAETSGRDRYVAFDSSGTASEIVTIRVGGPQIGRSTLLTWDHAGQVITARTDSPATTQFVLSFAADDRNEVRWVTSTCEAVNICAATAQTRTLAPGAEMRSTSAYALIEVSPRHLRTFASIADYFADRAQLDRDVDVDLRSTAALVDGNAGELLIAKRPTDNSYGFQRVGLLSKAGLRWTTFSTLPTASLGSIIAVQLLPSSAAFLIASADSPASAMQLWLCPLDVFRTGSARESARASCDLYGPPEEASAEIGVANNDLESLGVSMAQPMTCAGFLEVRESGWLWLLDPASHQQGLVPGTGLVNCSQDHRDAIVYRMRRIDDIRLSLEAAQPEKRSIDIVTSGYNLDSP
jgi:hypothetical protein